MTATVREKSSLQGLDLLARHGRGPPPRECSWSVAKPQSALRRVHW